MDAELNIRGISLSSVIKLEGNAQWTQWSRDIQDYLITNHLADTIDSPTAPAQIPGESNAAFTKKLNTWTTKQRFATTSVRSTLGINARALVETITTIPELLKILGDDLRSQGVGTYVTLINKCIGMKLSDYKDIAEYTAEFRRINIELREIDPELALHPSNIVQLFLMGLGPAYDNFHGNYNQSHSIMPAQPNFHRDTCFNELARAALDEEKRQANRNDGSSATALAAARQPGTMMVQRPYCEHCKITGHLESTCFVLHPELKAAFDARRKRGGYRGRGGRGAIQKGRSDSRPQEVKEEGPIAPVAAVAAVAATSSTQRQLESGYWMAMAAQTPLTLADIWIIDSGCSQHATYDRKVFKTYTAFPPNTFPISGIGGVKFQPLGFGAIEIVTNGVTLSVDHALHCPELQANLLSVHGLLQRRIGVNFTLKGCLLTNGEQKLFASQRNGLYVLEQAGVDHALAAYSVSDPVLSLWHDRMGHLAEENVKSLANMVTGLDLDRPVDSSCVCEPCVLGRMKDKPHNHRIRPGTVPMELIHTDVSGRQTVLGYDGSEYWVTFQCDATKYASVYTLKKRSDWMDKLIHFVQSHAPPGGVYRVRRIRSDNELGSTRFKMYCEKYGIAWEPTTPHNSVQNPKAERLNQTLLRRLHPTIEGAGIDKKWWPEVVQTISYLRNRSPARSIDKTPYEAWTHTKPDVSHLRAIGSEAWALQYNTKKLADDRAKKCILVGYEGDRIYRLIHPTGRIIRSSATHIVERVARKGFFATNQRTETDAIREKPVATEAPKRARDSDTEEGENSDRSSSPEPQHADLRIRGLAQRTDDLLRSLPPPPAPRPTVENGEEMLDTIVVSQTPRLRETLKAHPELRIPDVSEARRQRPSDGCWAALAQAQTVEPYEPKTHRQAKQCPDWPKWENGMKEELAALEDNETWRLVHPPTNCHVLSGRWVYKLKRGPHGEVIRHKARWVVRGFEQVEGLDYVETFASVVKPMSYKALFAMAAAQDLEIEQMDVTTAFLYGKVNEEIYVEQPTGLDDGTRRVCRLNRALYGLRQAPRIWYETIAKFFEEQGLRCIDADYSVFTDGTTYVALYVDDLLIIGPLIDTINKLKKALSHRFKMVDLGPCHYYLGMEITRDRPRRTLWLSQAGYLDKILLDHKMVDANAVATPMETSLRLTVAEKDHQSPPSFVKQYQSAVGSLMYAMLGTRPDIAFAVSVVSRYASNPTETHWKAVKRIFRYLRGTVNLRLTFRGDLTALTGYSDADWAGDHDTRRSTSGYVFNVGSGAISWSSKRQATVALSSTESEYMGQTQAVKEAIWLKDMLSQLNFNDVAATIIYCDNQGAMALAKNPQFHARTKHIDIQYHFSREKVSEGKVDLRYIPTAEQVADGLTKALCKDKFIEFRRALGLE